ncbi:hypothetical protein Tco_0292192 [Tanacetum coccineum]
MIITKSHSGSMSSMKNLDDTFNFGDQFLYDKPTEDDQEKSKVREESESTVPDPDQTVTSTPPVIAPFTDVTSSKPSLLVTPPPINTEATTITTSLPEITPFIALQLRVARLEQEMSEVKKTDHSADVLASIRSQVPTAVDKYLGTKLDDALLKVLERHTADLIEKYSVQPGPESIQNQESEKSPKEIIRIKREQDAIVRIVADKVKITKRKADSVDDKDDDDDLKALQLDQTRPIPESERPATPEPEWTIPPNDFPEPENNWANTYATAYKVPEENKLQRKTYDIGSFIKWFCRRTGKKKLCKADLEGPAFNLVKAFHKNNVFLQYQMDECHKLLTNKVDLSNPEGHQILRNIYEPLPLGGPPGDKERRIALSISKLKAARYLDFGLEELVPSLWVESEREYDISAVYGITHWWFRRKEFYINKHSESSDREAVRSQMRILSVISVKYNKGLVTRNRGLRMTRERSTDSSTAIGEKTTDQAKDSFKKDHLKMEMEIPSSSNVKLISECSDMTYTCYEVMKDLIKVSKLPQTLISYSSSQVHKMAIDY